jgi:hypothetical protein
MKKWKHAKFSLFVTAIVANLYPSTVCLHSPTPHHLTHPPTPPIRTHPPTHPSTHPPTHTKAALCVASLCLCSHLVDQVCERTQKEMPREQQQQRDGEWRAKASKGDDQQSEGHEMRIREVGCKTTKRREATERDQERETQQMERERRSKRKNGRGNKRERHMDFIRDSLQVCCSHPCS